MTIFINVDEAGEVVPSAAQVRKETAGDIMVVRHAPLWLVARAVAADNTKGLHWMKLWSHTEECWCGAKVGSVECGESHS